MAKKIITATLHDMTPIPSGSIYRGAGMVEFEFETVETKGVLHPDGSIEFFEVEVPEPNTIKKKFAEYDVEKNFYFKDKSIKNLKLKADYLVKEKEKTTAVVRVDK